MLFASPNLFCPQSLTVIYNNTVLYSSVLFYLSRRDRDTNLITIRLKERQSTTQPVEKAIRTAASKEMVSRRIYEAVVVAQFS